MFRTIFVTLLFISALSAKAQDVVEYIHTDALGSPVAITDAHGNVVDRVMYEPYGGTVNRPAKDGPAFGGHVADAETGLSYMQQRYFEPYAGRFLSADPVTAYEEGDWRHLNRYAFGFNSPYRYTDPDGRCPACDRFSDSYASMTSSEREGLRVAIVATVRTATTTFSDLNGPGSGGKAGAAGAVVKDVKIATALTRAKEVQGTLNPVTQAKVTTAVTETQEGIRVVSSSEGVLRPAQRAALKEGEVAAKGTPRTHAEVNGVNAAKQMGLTPTSVSPSRPACPGCQSAMKRENVKIVDN